MTRWVVDLEDASAEDPSLVGGKAAGLHRLIRAGLPVPEGFVVTVEAFRCHFPARLPTQRPPAPPLQPALERALQNALTLRFGPDAALAVRSSAPGEDGSRASYAGQHETYYHIRPNGVAEAVNDCWLSLWSSHAASYRAHRGSDDIAGMAVIVQRMLRADRSGVCFTCDPTGGVQPDRLWIEATWGLGAALVDGRVSPDRLMLDRRGQVLRRHTARKRHQVPATPHQTNEDRLIPVPLAEQTQPVLSDADAREVARYSLEAERLARSPQDVEWAYENGVFHLLQSRPITTVHARPDARDPERDPVAAARSRRRTRSSHWVLFKPLAENFTDPLTPMTVDLLRGVLPPGGRFIDGRFYLSLRAAHFFCPFRWTDRELADALLLRGETPELRWDWRKLHLAMVALALAYLTDGIGWHRSAHLTRGSLEQYALLCHRLRNRTTPEVPRVFQRLVLGRHPFEPIGRWAYYVNLSAARYFLLLELLGRVVKRYAPGVDAHMLSQLCSGDGETWSRRLVEGVRELADAARPDAELTRALGDGRDLDAVLAALAEDHPFVMALRRFLETFGHRAMREMELSVPRWREDPLPLLLMIRAYLRSPVTVRRQDGHARYLLARDTLRRALPRRWQWRLVDALIRRVRYYTSLREDTRHYHAMAMDVARARLLNVEQSLLTAGRLRLAGDLFYLTWEEARSLLAQELTWNDVAGRVRRRRRLERAAIRAGAATIVSEGPEPLDEEVHAPRLADGKGTVLTGQCASPGFAEGRVRIVLDPATAHDLQAGEVLVAPYTDPAWTPLFPLAAAVVVELGSFLSHAGTVAREYAIPCLVDVTDCTQRLLDGQRVRVYASEGRLEVVGR